MKKGLVLLLALAILVSLTAGCAPQSTTTGSAAATTATTATTAKATTTETTKPSLLSAPGELPIVTEPVKLTIGIKPNATVLDYDNNSYTKKIEAETGIDIEFYYFPIEDTTQKIELMTAANEKLPDIIGAINLKTARYNYGKRGLLLPLNEYLDTLTFYWDESLEKYSNPKQVESLMIQAKSPDGNIYAMPYLLNDPTDNQDNNIYINKTWLDYLKLSVPKTTDDLYNVLISFRDNDPNQNDKMDELPFVGYNDDVDGWGDIFQLVNAFTYYNAEMYNRLIVDANDQLSVAYIQDDFKEALKYLNKLYVENLIAPISFTQDGTQFQSMLDLPEGQDIIVGAAVCHPHGYGWSTGNEYSTIFNYTYLEPLTGPKGQAWSVYKAYGQVYTTSITKYCEHPDVAFRLLDYFCKEDVALSGRFGVQDVNWEYAAEGDKGRMETLGYGAIFRIIDNLSGNKNSSTWVQSMYSLPPYLFASEVVQAGDDKVSNYRDDLFYNGFFSRVDNVPQKIVTTIVYSEEESKEINEILTTINAYATTQRMLFVTGEKSIENDWDAYLATLNQMGLEQVLTVCQTAYDRMYH